METKEKYTTKTGIEKIDFKTLFTMQKQLDEHIVTEKGLEGQDLLPEKILALRVELGELANEWRGFKFWSEDREPNKWKECEVCTDQPGYLEIQIENEIIEVECPICQGHSEIYVGNRLLEEYVDCLHFILSIGLDLNMEHITPYPYGCPSSSTIPRIFTSLMANIEYFLEDEDEYNYAMYFCQFIGLGEMLGFSWDQIIQAYLEKNQINHKRQEGGY